MTLEELALQGKHNLYNSMAAGIGSKLIEIRKDTIKKCLTDISRIESNAVSVLAQAFWVPAEKSIDL